jgi:TolB protein
MRPRLAPALALLVALAAGCGGGPARQSARHAQRHAPAQRQAPTHRQAHAQRTRYASRHPIALSSLHGQIAYSHANQIWIARADGSHARPLTGGRGPKIDPSWAPGGHQIAYRDSRHGFNRNDELYVIDADGRRAMNITRSPENEWSPSWSPDGGLIAYYSGELWAMRPDGTHAHAITDVEGEYPAWSPDGTKLAFMSGAPDARGIDPNYDVFVVNRDGSGLRRLTDWPGEDGYPAWSPDGKRIAFSSTHGGPGPLRYLLYVMNADGSDKRRVAHGMLGAYPVWSPDGREILFTGGPLHHPGNRLWVVRPNGSGLRRLPLEGWLVDWQARQ